MSRFSQKNERISNVFRISRAQSAGKSMYHRGKMRFAPTSVYVKKES